MLIYLRCTPNTTHCFSYVMPWKKKIKMHLSYYGQRMSTCNILTFEGNRKWNLGIIFNCEVKEWQHHAALGKIDGITRKRHHVEILKKHLQTISARTLLLGLCWVFQSTIITPPITKFPTKSMFNVQWPLQGPEKYVWAKWFRNLTQLHQHLKNLSC